MILLNMSIKDLNYTPRFYNGTYEEEIKILDTKMIPKV